jgi:hypothetical protein
LPSGSPPTAALAAGALTLGIPAGPQGNPGVDASRTVIAAGRFGPQGGLQWSFDDLTATRVTGIAVQGLFYLTSDYIKSKGADRNYVVEGTIVTTPDDQPHTFEVVLADANLKQLLEPLGPAGAQFDVEKGLFARAIGIDRKTLGAGFIVEISDYTDV